MRTCLYLTVTFTLLLSFCLEASAKPPSRKIARLSKPTFVDVNTFSDGDTIRENASFYNSATDKLTISGKFKKIPKKVKGTDLKVIINGINISTILGSTLEFRSTKKGGRYRKGAFSVELGIPPREEFPMLDVTVELVYIPTDQVLARETLSLYDLRRHNITTTADPVVAAGGLDYQLTDTGLGNGSLGAPEALEIPTFNLLPYPSLDEFNQRLEINAERAPNQSVGELEACINYEDIEESRLKNIFEFPAYAQAFAEAEFYYASYVAMQNGSASCGALFGIGSVICQAGLQAYCVKSPPKANDFKLCVDSIRGEPKSVSINNVSDIDLRFVDSQSETHGIIDSEVDIFGFHALVDGHLEDFTVRWRDKTCVGRPGGELDNGVILEKPWLEEWATCRDMEIDSQIASTRTGEGVSAQYYVTKDPSDRSRLYVADSRLAEFDFEDTTLNADKGTCSKEFLTDESNAFIRLFTKTMQGVLNYTWSEGSPESPTSKLLDDLLQPIAIGDVELDKYQIHPSIQSVRSGSTAGLIIEYQTVTEPTEDEAWGRLSPFYVGQGGAQANSYLDGLDNDGLLFDSRYGITAPFLNRVLWARSATSELNKLLDFSDTLSAKGRIGSIDGGIGNPDPVIPVPQNEVDGKELAALHPGLSQLSKKTLVFELSREIDPFIFLPPDPPQLLPVGYPISYGAHGLNLKIKAPDTTRTGKKGKTKIKKGKTFIEANITFLEDDFSFLHPALTGDEKLVPFYANPSWYLDIVDMDLPGCPMFSHENSQARFGTCEQLVEVALRGFVQSHIEETMFNLLAEIPAPQFFDLEGAVATGVQADNQSRTHSYGRIDLFGDL